MIKSIIYLNSNKIPYFQNKSESHCPLLTPEALLDSSILITNNTYCYRVGIFGYLIKILSNQICTKSRFLVNKVNKWRNLKSKFECSDLQLLTFGVSYINSMIPLLNICTVNERYKCTKNYKFKYGYHNNSLPSMFSSFYSPYFDSGCAILSNYKPLYTDFIPFQWKNEGYLDKLVNKGILYNFFKSESESYLIITFNFSDNKSKNELLIDIDDVMTWLSKLEIESEDKYYIFIIGDFKMYIDENDNDMRVIIGELNIKHLGNTSYLIHNIHNDNINCFELDNGTIEIVLPQKESIRSESCQNTNNVIFNSENLEESCQTRQIIEDYYNKSPKSLKDSWTIV